MASRRARGVPADFLRSRDGLWQHAAAALDSLRERHDLVVAEGAAGAACGNLLGTIELMPEADYRLIRSFLINRFRGEESFLAPAIEDLEQPTGIPVLGVIP